MTQEPTKVKQFQKQSHAISMLLFRISWMLRVPLGRTYYHARHDWRLLLL